MLTVCSLLSGPSLMLFWNGDYNDVTEGMRDTKSFFAAFTLGNIGQRSTLQCRSLPINQMRTSVELYCQFGQVNSLAAFGTGEKQENRCMQNAMDDPVISPECDLRSHIQADFDEKCVGQKQC